MSNVDYVHTNTHSSQGDSPLYKFEYSEAVIKMIIKGRSATVRHVSRTYRVALAWLVVRQNQLGTEDPNQICGHQKKLADLLTKGIFTRDEWNHLLRLHLIMSFSMFSCSHVSHFLSDPIGKQSAMSKRGQEATSSEGSPMAKRRPMVPAKTRTVNLVLRSPWSARENPPQDLGYPVDSVNADEGQGSQTGTRKLVRTTQSPQVESYQVRREEKAQNSNPWKQDDTEVSSYSYWYRETCTDSDSKDRVSKYEVHKPSRHDEDLPFLSKVGEVLEEKGGLCEGANPFAVAFHRDVYLFEGFTGTEDLHEALRKDGFQSLFVAQSKAREVFLRMTRLFFVQLAGQWPQG